jgi:hypothetical protein
MELSGKHVRHKPDNASAAPRVQKYQPRQMKQGIASKSRTDPIARMTGARLIHRSISRGVAR